jgi:four helix bundle protein
LHAIVGGMRSYEDLTFYQEMFELTLELYPWLATYPKYETYGLASQMRGSAVSYLSNIAEGSARGTAGENANSVSNASGSAAELECQIKLSKRLGFLPPDRADDFLARLERIRRQTYGFYRWLKNPPPDFKS